ncbi:MAG: hypothetical protein STSR0008_15460 [Ignavibacterium sp.]
MLTFLLSMLFLLNGDQSSINRDVPFDSVMDKSRCSIEPKAHQPLAEISNYLQTKLSNYSKWNYEIISKPNVLNNAHIKFEINKSKEFKVNGQYAYVPIIIRESNNKISYSLLTLKLELYDTVLIAINEIKNNDIISSNNVEYKIENVTNFRRKILTNENLLNLLKAKRKINKGEILYENMFTELPLINQGDKLQAHFVYGNITISFDVEARENGFTGKQIRVIDTNNKIYSALVLNKNNVKIIKP